MTRVWRWMRNGLTLLSLALCVGTCVLWARSRHPRYDSVSLRLAPDHGFIALTSNDGEVGIDVEWIVPYWLVAAAAGLAPAVWTAHRFWQRRNAVAAVAGLCSVCGYDLRATPDRCPECGTIPSNRP